MKTIKELFPDMKGKQRTRLGEALKNHNIKPIQKAPETHYVNAYSDDDEYKIVLIAAGLFGEN